MTIYEKLSDWFKQCPIFEGWIFFNTIPMEPNTASITSVQNMPFVNEFNDGSKVVDLLFDLNIVEEYDADGTSNLNLIAMSKFEKISNWIEDQNLIDNLPSLENIIVDSITESYTNPEVYVNEETGLARYEGQYKISYLERSLK